MKKFVFIAVAIFALNIGIVSADTGQLEIVKKGWNKIGPEVTGSFTWASRFCSLATSKTDGFWRKLAGLDRAYIRCEEDAVFPAPLPTSTPLLTPSPALTPSPTPTPSLTPRVTPTPTPLLTPSPTPIPTPTPTRPPALSTKKGLALSDMNYCDRFFSDAPVRLATCKTNHAAKVNALKGSWYYSWYTELNYRTRLGPTVTMEYVPMIWGRYDDATMRVYKRFARENPGSYWLIFNEPDAQSNLNAQQVAFFFHDIYIQIKGVDANAKFIVGGWVDYEVAYWQVKASAFVNSYKSQFGVKPPVDGYHVHFYTCNGDDMAPTYWRGRITSFRTWMDSVSPGKELWLTEFGCIENDANYKYIMDNELNWMENYSGIQRYAWFVAGSWAVADKIHAPLFGGGYLFSGFPENTNSFVLTPVGKYYAKFPN